MVTAVTTDRGDRRGSWGDRVGGADLVDGHVAAGNEHEGGKSQWSKPME